MSLLIFKQIIVFMDGSFTIRTDTEFVTGTTYGGA
jgi:hypothetical protein